MSPTMHFLDHSMHRPLSLCVREGILIILFIIIPIVRLRVVYALFGTLTSLEIIPLVAQAFYLGFFQSMIIMY